MKYSTKNINNSLIYGFGILIGIIILYIFNRFLGKESFFVSKCPIHKTNNYSSPNQNDKTKTDCVAKSPAWAPFTSIAKFTCSDKCEHNIYINQNTQTKHCIECKSYERWDKEKNICVQCPSNNNSVWNGSKCTPTCPKEKPYEFGIDCVNKCPISAPNLFKNKCVINCPLSAPILHTVNNNKTCRPRCNDNEAFFNGKCIVCQDKSRKFYDKKCIKTCPKKAPNLIGIECVENCPPDLPNLNGTKCTACPENSPKWDGNKCEACPTDEPYWDKELNKCYSDEDYGI